MKKLVWILLFVLLSLSSEFVLAEAPQAASTTAQQNSMTPQQVLQQLELGNQRFLTNTTHTYNYSHLVSKTAEGQDPMAVVLSCLDSRSSPDILFDQGIGNIFVARVAGNVIDKKILGSIEFATKVYAAKLIVVMGHTNCGAMKGACEDVRLANLTYVIKAIQPAVSQIRQQQRKKFSCDSSATIDAIAKQNVLDQMQLIRKYSPIIAGLVKQKKIMIVGAMQNVATGKVTFFDSKGNLIN